MTELVRANKEHKSIVVDILSESFNENISINFVIKSDHKREQRIRALMEYSFDMCLSFGEVYLTADQSACALILWSEKKKTVLKWDVRLLLRAIVITRAFKVLNRESKISKKHPVEPFCYLWFIGVKKSMQRNGLGTTVLKQIIDVCNTKKLDICLETSTISNIPWYQKNDFKVYDELDFGYKLYMLKHTQG